MNKLTKYVLSIVLSVAVAFSMCFTLPAVVYADEGASDFELISSEAMMASTPVVKYNGASITAASANSSSSATYVTPTVSDKSEYFYYSVKVPMRGTLEVVYASSSSDVSNYVNVTGNGASFANSKTADNVKAKYYYIPTAGTVTLEVDVSAYNTVGAVVFAVVYAPANKTVSLNKECYVGATNYNTASTITVKSPGKGYLDITAKDSLDGYSIDYRAPGFKDWETIYSSGNGVVSIGVKKGTYKISLKRADIYKVKVTFHKVKAKAKTSKKKALTLKKKKAQKGLYITDAKKKANWYKLKIKKNQKVKIIFNAKHMSQGNSYGGKVKITAYFPNGKTDYATHTPGTSGTYTLTYGSYGTKKAKSGTFYLKIQSQKGANGYYTIKWK